MAPGTVHDLTNVVAAPTTAAGSLVSPPVEGPAASTAAEDCRTLDRVLLGGEVEANAIRRSA